MGCLQNLFSCQWSQSYDHTSILTMKNDTINEVQKHFIIRLPMEFVDFILSICLATWQYMPEVSPFSCHRWCFEAVASPRRSMVPTLPATVTWWARLGVLFVSLGTTAEAEAESPKNLPVTLAADELPIVNFQQKTRVSSTNTFWIGTIAAKRLSYAVYIGSSCILGVWMLCRTWVFTHGSTGIKLLRVCEAPDGSPRRSQGATWLRDTNSHIRTT